MKIIYNNIIPFKGFKAINLFGIVFARKLLDQIDVNHESIHTAQMKELFYIGFYLWYLIEYLILFCKNHKTAYRNIRFEKEAYDHERDLNYLNYRPNFNYL